MKTITQLQSEANKAPKFVLCAYDAKSGNFLYVSDSSKTSCTLTFNIKNANKFAYGFDDEAIKAKAWSLSTGYEFADISA